MTFVSFSAFFLHFSLRTLLSSCFFPDTSPEDSNREGGGGAQTEASEIRAEPPGQPEQRAGPLQENGGEVTKMSTKYACVLTSASWLNVCTFVPPARSCRKRRTQRLFSWTKAAGVWLSWRRRRRAQTRASNAHREWWTTSKVSQLSGRGLLKYHHLVHLIFMVFLLHIVCSQIRRAG